MRTGRPARREPLRAMTVVIPARDEEGHLPACLRAVDTAVAHLATRRPGLVADVLVVLDDCSDRSSDVVAAHGHEALPVTACSVGGARALGAARALDRLVVAPGSWWMACTDADTVVPPDWLVVQAEAADDGLDALVGTVEPDALLPPLSRALWSARNALVEGHLHVHGANLGVRGSAYLAAGGFAPLGVHEDVDLVDRLRATPGVRVRATDAHRVVTSSRHHGRTGAGFAGYLRDLAGEAG